MLASYKKCFFDFLFKSLKFLRQKTILGQSVPHIAPFGAIIYIYIYIYTCLFSCTPSRQILVLRTSRGRLPPTSQGRPLKILFDRPGDVPIWRLGDVLKQRPDDVLIWRSRDVPRTFSGRPLEDLQGTQTWMSPNFFLTFVSELIRLIKSI